MNESVSNADVERLAAEWVARVDRGLRDEAEAAELQAWLAGDSRRRGAYVRAQAAWVMLDRASAFAPDLGASEPSPSAPFRRRALFAGAAIAASVMAVALVGSRQWGGPDAEPKRYRTTIGEVQQIRLVDGSAVSINTSSALAIAMDSERRRVELIDGEALFEVAKDTTRPFVVEIGSVRVRAVGTAFAIRRHPGGADVIVSEGVVEAWSEGAGGSMVRIDAGFQASIPELRPAGRVQPVSAASVERHLLWRHGRIALDGRTIEEAATEINRFNLKRVVVHPALARERLVGVVDARKPQRFAAAAALSVGGRVRNDGDVIHIEPQASGRAGGKPADLQGTKAR